MIIIQFISINQFLFLDVSGGQSCSILDAMRSALQISIHLSLMKDNYKALNYKDVFHMATLGGAAGTLFLELNQDYLPHQVTESLIQYFFSPCDG